MDTPRGEVGMDSGKEGHGYREEAMGGGLGR